MTFSTESELEMYVQFRDTFSIELLNKITSLLLLSKCRENGVPYLEVISTMIEDTGEQIKETTLSQLPEEVKPLIAPSLEKAIEDATKAYNNQSERLNGLPDEFLKAMWS